LSQTAKSEFCYTGHVEYDIIKRFAAYGHPSSLVSISYFLTKKGGNGFYQSCAKMCARNKRTAADKSSP